MTFNWKRIAAVAALASCASGAHAGLVGDTVDLTWTYNGLDWTTSTTVATPDHALGWWLAGHWTVGDDYIDFQSGHVFGFDAGVSWTFSSLDFGGIGGVTVDTNFQGWRPDMLSFTDDTITVSFGRIEFDPNQGHIRFGLQRIAAPVPEPETLALFALGLGGVCLARRRRPA